LELTFKGINWFFRPWRIIW